jgi:hypothetical protein
MVLVYLHLMRLTYLFQDSFPLLRRYCSLVRTTARNSRRENFRVKKKTNYTLIFLFYFMENKM